MKELVNIFAKKNEVRNSENDWSLDDIIKQKPPISIVRQFFKKQCKKFDHDADDLFGKEDVDDGKGTGNIFA